MDIDQFMKSATEDQMEMMLMQMEKLPDFSGSYEDGSDDQIPMAEFTSHNEDSDRNTFYEHLHANSPAFISPHPSNMSYSGGDSPYPPPGWDGDEFSGAAEKRGGSMAAMREMIFRIAAMQPVHIDPESVKPPKRKNVKISTDPQSVAARHRRERISERIRILQRLVPGGTKMDTASMLDEAIHYVKFLKNQVQSLERVAANRPAAAGMGFPVPMSAGNYFPVAAGKGYHQYPTHQHSLADA